jgi:hypothetical protein
MAQYLISVWHDDEYEVDFSGEDMQRIAQQVGELNEQMASAGVMVFGGGMQPASTAAVLRWGGSGVVETTGSYGGTAPQMGGFWIVEVADREAALEWGRLATRACEGPVEVRAFHDGPEG